MTEPLKFATVKLDYNNIIRDKLQELSEYADKDNYVAMAVVLIRADGNSFVSTFGKGNRLQILGAIADFQYTIAKDGD